MRPEYLVSVGGLPAKWVPAKTAPENWTSKFAEYDSTHPLPLKNLDKKQKKQSLSLGKIH